MNLMKLDGYHAKIEFDEETDRFLGEILRLSGGADFYGSSPAELCREFKNSLDVFLEVCKEQGVEPLERTGHHRFPARALQSLPARKVQPITKDVIKGDVLGRAHLKPPLRRRRRLKRNLNGLYPGGHAPSARPLERLPLPSAAP